MVTNQMQRSVVSDEPTNGHTPPVNVDETLADKSPIVAPVESELSLSSESSIPEGKTFGSRAGAYILDGFIIYATTFAGGFAGVFLLSFVLAVADRPLMQVPAQRSLPLESTLISFVLVLAYFTVFEWLYGASPGKVILKMRVVREDGRRPSLWAALVRGLFRLIDGLFFGAPAALAMQRDLRRQRIGDRYAHTLVVGHRDPVIQEQRSWVWFVVASVLCLIIFSSGTALLTFENLEIAPPRTTLAASHLNLTLEDLGEGFELFDEVGKDAFQDTQLTDASVRRFTSEQMVLHAQVMTFPFLPSDTIEELMTSFTEDLTEEDVDHEFIFTPAREVQVGERAGVLRFDRTSTGEVGYMLIFIRRNVVTQLVSYGASGAMSEDELVRLASIVDARIQ